MAKTPFPPIVNRILPPKYGAGMDRGNTRRTGNTTIHTMVGTLDGTDAWFRLPWVHSSTHWGIGGSLDGIKDGIIYQWVDMGSDKIPWASGPWNSPGFGDGLNYVKKFGVYGINAYSDSIETSGQVATPMTLEQWKSLIWLCAAIVHDGGMDSESFSWNMHHREFTKPSYKDCPFARIYNYTIEYQKGILLTLQHYEGKGVREEFVKIGKLNVPLPIFQGTQPEPPPPPVFHAFTKPRRAELWAATARQYGNTTAKIYATYKAGTKLWFDGYYEGQEVSGDNRWYVVDSDKRERIHSSGIKQWLPDEPEKVKKFAMYAAHFPAEVKNAETASPHWL